MRERENFICKAGTPEGQPPINAGAYVTVYNNAHVAQGNIKEWGHTNKSKSTNEHTKHKPRLNTQKKDSAQPGCMNWSW